MLTIPSSPLTLLVLNRFLLPSAKLVASWMQSNPYPRLAEVSDFKACLSFLPFLFPHLEASIIHIPPTKATFSGMLRRSGCRTCRPLLDCWFPCRFCDTGEGVASCEKIIGKDCSVGPPSPPSHSPLSHSISILVRPGGGCVGWGNLILASAELFGTRFDWLI